MSQAVQLEHARTDLESCRLGNCTVGKLPLGKIPLGSCRLGESPCESIYLPQHRSCLGSNQRH